MQEYLANGLRLGWLLDPETQVVEIYRPDQAIEILNNPAQLLGEAVLPGFRLDLQPFSFGFATPDTRHPTPLLTELWLIRLRTAVNGILS